MTSTERRPIKIEQHANQDGTVVGKANGCLHFCYQTNKEGQSVQPCPYYERTLDGDWCCDPCEW